MKVIIRSPKSEDYDRFSNIMDQVQQLHVEWRPDVYKPASPLITREVFEEILKEEAGALGLALTDGQLAQFARFAQALTEKNKAPGKTGDALDLGEGKLVFVEAPMLHWPDSMFCYLTGDNILFSNDAFGQHYASEHMFNDLVDQAELMAECIKYYANILTPFSELVTKKIKKL